MPMDERINDLGARLGGLAAEGASRVNPPPPATIRRRSRRSRRRRAVITVIAAVAVAGAMAVVRASWPQPAPPTTPVGPLPGQQVVPWIPAPATSTPVEQGPPPTVPPGTPACTTRQLQASVGWEGATGSVAGWAAFTNRGKASCVLAGYPTIELLDRHGQALPLTGDPPLGTSKTNPPAVPVRSGSRAHVEFQWMNWCGPNPGPLSVRITLPRGGVLVPTIDPITPRKLTPRCDAPGSPSRLSRGPFVAEAPQPPPDPLSALHVKVAVDSVLAGQRLRYTVTLTNPTDTPLSLGECPSYEERVSLDNGGTASERHLLNCPPVGAIGAGQQVTFAMVLDIPAALRPGNGVLVWELLPHGPPGTKAPITLNTRG